MADEGVGPDVQECRQFGPEWLKYRMADRVHAGMDRVQRAFGEPMFDCPAAQAGRQQLHTVYDATLGVRDQPDCAIPRPRDL